LDRFLECALFVAGLAFGSFLNVCISRIPRDESVISPRSHCRSCGSAIPWYHNIPVVSWIALRGRCRQCAARISWRYPAVELLTGILFTATYLVFGWSWLALKLCLFSFLVVGLICMDAETGLLPREFTYSGIVLGLGFAWIAPTNPAGTAFLLRLFSKPVANVHRIWLLDALLGALVGAGFFYVAWALYYLVRRRHGLGFGDIALMAMAGAFLGLKLILLVIFWAPILGIVYALLLVALEKAGGAKAASESREKPSLLHREIPFGVLLGACSLLAVFFGDAAWSWYLRRF